MTENPISGAHLFIEKGDGSEAQNSPIDDLANRIKEEIITNGQDGQLPNRARLTRRYKTTPQKLQEAFAVLEESGLVWTVHRKGTFVNSEELERLQKELLS